MFESDAGIAYKWRPIEPLNVIGSSYDFSEIDSLQRQWLSIRKRREESNPQTYKAFLERLERRWAIETGIIEGLYTLDKDVTETLVQRGFNAELIDRNSTNKDPAELVRILQDHQEASEGVYHYIRQGSPLSIMLIRQLHVVLTQHQPTYTAHDQFGKVFETALTRGGFKTMPNNPIRPDGGIHEYCPPVQVDSEIDNLVDWHSEHRTEGYHPLLVAAWLHHAFTQIHPFQDGNGRVARALITWHLVRENYLSVVVSRDARSGYIDALEAADSGNLDAFVDFLVRLEMQTIQEALAEPEPIEGSRRVEQALDNIVGQVNRRDRSEENRLRSVTEIGKALFGKAAEYLEVQSEQIRQKLHETNMPVTCSLQLDDTGAWERWYENQILKTAQDAGHWVNFNEGSFLVKLSITPLGQERGLGGYPGVTFLISLHHTGRQLSGVMAATAFALIDFPPYHSVDRSIPSFGPNYRNCAANPFTFTSADDSNAIAPRFFNWTEEALSEALGYWQEFLA